MKRHLQIIAGLLLLGLVAGWWIAAGGTDANSSVLSRGPRGWSAMRAYLEARGTPIHLLDSPPGRRLEDPVLVLGFPWQEHGAQSVNDAVADRLQSGGTVLVAYSSGNAPGAVERAFLAFIGVDVKLQKASVPLNPVRWYRRAQETWQLEPAFPHAAPLPLRRPRWLPVLPLRAHLLLRGPEGRGVAAAWQQGRGRLVLVPAELLCNARLRNAADAALLETLHTWLPGAWSFDEYHHGLSGVAVTGEHRHSLDLLLAQLALVYLAAVASLVRRQGPAWREPPVLAGTASGFLVRLGRLHDRLGHHRRAAQLLLERAVRYDSRITIDRRLQEAAEDADGETFLRLARRVGRLQARSKEDA